MDVQVGDETVTLRDRLGFREATTITMALATFPEENPELRASAMLAMMSEWYIVYGVESWTLDLPVTEANIRDNLLTHPDVIVLVEAAVAHYQEQVVDPLVKAARSSSPRSQTNGSTSRTPRGAKRPRKPSKPSLITHIPTDDTGTTSSSPDGAYSSSQNLDLVG